MPLHIGFGDYIGGSNIGSSGPILDFLARFDFPVDDDAPITSPYTEGTGTLNFTQTTAGDRYSIVGSELVYPSAPSIGSSGALDAVSRTRTPGLALAASVKIKNFGGGNSALPAAWKADNNVNGSAGGGKRWGIFFTAAALYIAADSNTALQLQLHYLGVRYLPVIVLQSTGALMFIKGGRFTNWTLYHVSTQGTSTPVYALLTPVSGGLNANQNTFRETQLSSLFTSTTEFLHAEYSGSVSSGEVFTNPANCIYDFTLTTLPSAGVISICPRYQDANNKWSLEIGTTGAMNLYTTVAGVKTLVSGPVTASAGNRIVITAHKSYMNANVAAATSLNLGVIRNILASQSGGILESLGTGGVISNLKIYKMDTSTDVRAELDAIFVGKTSITKQIVAHGDSITLGATAGTPSYVEPFGLLAATLLGTEWGAAEYGTSGATIAANQLTNSGVVVDAYDSNLEQNVAVHYIGTNDLYGSGADVGTMTPLATMQTNIATLCQQSKDAGFYTIACTLASIGSTSYDATIESQRQAYNTWMQANYTTFADALLDIGANATLGAPNACNNTTYFVSKIHWTAAAHALVGQMLADLL